MIIALLWGILSLISFGNHVLSLKNFQVQRELKFLVLRG